MTGERVQERREIVGRQHQHRRDLSGGESFDAVEDGEILRGEFKGLIFGQRVQRRAAAARFYFEADHNFPAGNRLFQVWRQDQE